MPPKKVQQQAVNPAKSFYVLPLFMNDSPVQSDAEKILRSKPINIKKCIDQNKIIEILKDKGLAQHLTPEGEIQPEGRKFICSNFKTVLQEATIQAPKLPDKKGPQPKKKGVAVQPAVEENKEPTIELTMDKKCDHFIFLLDFPQTSDELRACIENGLKIDAVIVIEQKVKKGSNPPNYDLLGQTFEQNELMSALNTTKIRQQPRAQKAVQQQQQLSRTNSAKKMLKSLRRIKNQNPEFSNLIITDVPFQKDISHPENNEKDFINSVFTKLCQTTVEKQKYENWIKNDVKKNPMIQPLKEVVKKQVLIQTQKTGGKKDANKEPEYETVEEVIETKYESLPQNIKSDLKLYRQLAQIHPKNDENSVRKLVQNCLLSVQLQLGKSSQSVPSINPELTLRKITSKPLAKVNFIDSLKQNLRKVQPFSNTQLKHNLIHQPKEIQKKLNLIEIIHQSPQQKQILQFEFIMMTLTDFIKQQEPKLKWDFSDRVYRQKLSTTQVLSQIQKELLRDPKIYEGILKHDNIKLLCMAKINPPGRVLYSNDIFTPKAVPDFQNWVTKFKTMQNAPQQFLDYNFQDVGNLSIKRQKPIPTDNVVICDQKISIGNDTFKLNNFDKMGTFYGLKQLNEEKNEFWLTNTKQKLSLSIFQQEHQFKKTSKITQMVKEEGSSEQQSVQRIVESVETEKRVEMWFRTENFIISHTPYPTINWQKKSKQNRSGQVRRQFGPKGEITSYQNDGSVKMFYLNGNVSTFRNNQWQRVVNNDLCSTDGPNRKLETKQFTEGDKSINVRQDQTIFIEYSNGNTLTIFSDDTKVLHKKRQNIFEIRTFNSQLSEEIIVRVTLPKNSDVNIIGHGSAFAYLGFKNLFQRSVDGFLYEVWHNQFCTYLYNEKYDYEHKIYEDEIRLVHLQDGSLIKVQANDHISFAQGDYDHSEEKLRSKWNQIFALEQNHEVGVYDINLTQGTIKTKDAESNKFAIHVAEENNIEIAVSFKISEDEKMTNNYGNGFHVPEQNYFLPVPENCPPPRIFTFDNNSHQYYEYLTPQQVRQMEVSSSVEHIETYSVHNKTIHQYTKQVKKNCRFEEDKKVIAFSKTPQSKEYEIPGILLPRQTKVNMSIENENVFFRCIEKVEWSKDFGNLTKITEKITKQKQLRLKEIQFGRD